MRHYRQHPIALLRSLLASLALSGLGLGLVRLMDQPLPLILVLLALLLAILRVVRWAAFVVRIERRQVMLRRYSGFVVTEQVIPLLTPGGLRLRQNLLGWLFDYGLIRIETLGTPVQIQYIAPFSSLKRQIEAG
jgi:hypothetical protein